MRKGTMIILEKLHKYDVKNFKEVLPCRHGDIVVFDEDIDGIPVTVDFNKKIAITTAGAKHPTCDFILTGEEFFDNFYK